MVICQYTNMLMPPFLNLSLPPCQCKYANVTPTANMPLPKWMPMPPQLSIYRLSGAVRNCYMEGNNCIVKKID